MVRLVGVEPENGVRDDRLKAIRLVTVSRERSLDELKRHMHPDTFALLKATQFGYVGDNGFGMDSNAVIHFNNARAALQAVLDNLPEGMRNNSAVHDELLDLIGVIAERSTISGLPTQHLAHLITGFLQPAESPVSFRERQIGAPGSERPPSPPAKPSAK